MPDMTMIERVARAICQTQAYFSVGRSPIDKLVDECWDDSIDEARAAIEAYEAAKAEAALKETT